ncbi:hypothetical protein M231_03243 [Tremella mesenterica]|uniref:Signal recognition particle receptor subunit beta n=1 Tax=Tremella mesenterica TaxID=5217 RepID=A0A4Q1BNW3_TREME|nr:uncharacterized protein TREMEDRAFT_62381 [Tremella mesenterica DSM 1558]EIW69523.1 hypothetical protein TREMEDRAFT_62381 [Tremella mesenterica DSM 1558]RXK39573.1 hypothetical protein M231_03243 [Tremella mesenterica]
MRSIILGLIQELDKIREIPLQTILQDPKFVAAIVGIFILVLFFTFFRSTSRKPQLNPSTILLVGPSDSGKTSLFSQLAYGTYPNTHTSIKSSTTTFTLQTGKKIRLVDLPGHPRLRDGVTKNLREADGVVFVVDIVGLVRNAGMVAEQLPPILTTLSNLSRHSSKPIKLILLANKTDLLIRPSPPPSPSPPNIPSQTLDIARERLRFILTREMDRLKSSRASASGKIEGMSKVSGVGTSFWSRLFGGTVEVEGEGEGEEDEGLVWGGRGMFKWEDVEGVEIIWAASGLGVVRSGSGVIDENESEGNGLDELKGLLEEL